jgi:hypothetical protein
LIVAPSHEEQSDKLNKRGKAETVDESASIRTPEQPRPCLKADLVVGRVTRGERLPFSKPDRFRADGTLSHAQRGWMNAQLNRT